MSLRVSLGIVLADAVGLSLLIGLLYGTEDGFVTLALLAPPSAVAVTIAHALAERRRRLGSLRRQFVLTAAIATGQLLLAFAVGSGVMFVSTHDAVLALVFVALTVVVAARTVGLLAHGILGDVRALRDTLLEVGHGARDPVDIPPSQDELGELAAAADATIARLAATERARRNLIAAVSHDLRTPITSLRLIAEAVEDGVLDGEARERYLRQMRDHVGLLSGLIDDLFELSRLEAGDVQWSLERVAVAELVESSVLAMQVQADARRVRVAAAVAGAVPHAQGNPERLRRVLFNLIQNAIRHTPADGSVTVSAHAAGGAVEIEVADTGTGIDPEERARVFEPFYRSGENAARRADGAGLGLAIAQAIVEAHGGRIWFADAERGTRVRFSVPRATGRPPHPPVLGP